MNPGDTEFPPICAECREPIVRVKTGVGKRNPPVMRCACNPAPEKVSAAIARKCNPKSTKRKGRVGERNAEKEWRDWGWDAQSTVGSGSAGSRSGESAFDTDVVLRRGNDRLKLESKKHKTLPIKGCINMLDRSDVLRLETDGGETFYFLTKRAMGILAERMQ